LYAFVLVFITTKEDKQELISFIMHSQKKKKISFIMLFAENILYNVSATYIQPSN